MQSNFDNNLQSYFTDMEHLRGMFKEFVAAPSLPKRIVVIHGVGGSGKSSLLRMFRIHCKSEKIPVALASGDDAKSVFDVITRWMDDLKADGVKFSSLSKTMETYHAIQAKVGDQAKKSQNAGSRIADIASKAASKTAETAGGALLGAAIGSVIPGVGTAIGGALGGVLSGMGAEALTDSLRGFLSKSDIDLLLDPDKRLTADFLADITKAAEKKRIVLLLDTYEQMTALEDWVGSVGQKIHPNILMIVAGRKLPNWNRSWQDWMASAQVEELKPMTEDIMRELIRRYYATIRGGEPASAQVDAIILFARGLPMVVTSAVQLWVKYGVEDFQSVKAEIVANLVDRLMEGVPSALIPALEAAAVVRWFDQPILRAVTGLEDVRDIYNELRRFPFVRTRAEGFALHDSVREMMGENLRMQDSERHSELHERAAVYFEKRLEKVTDEESGRLGLERLYHRVRADEEAGIKLFQEMAEPLARYQFVGRLRILVNDVNTYPLDNPNSRLWREYYNARLFHINVQISEAEKLYKSVSDDEDGEPKLRAYALCDLAQMCAQDPKVFLIISKSQQLAPILDSKLAFNFSSLRYAYMFIGELDKAVDALRQQYEFYKGIGDKNGTVYSLDMLKDIYGLLGDWKMAAMIEKEALGILNLMPSNPFLYTRIVGHNLWYKVWSGRYSEAESGMKRALVLAEKEEQIDSFPGLYRDLGFVLGLQRRWRQSQEYFLESSKKYQERGESNTGLGSTHGFWGAILVQQGKFQEAKEYLTNSLSIKKEIQDNNGIPEILVWLGQMSEMEAKEVQGKNQNDFLSQAESYYIQCLSYRWTGRHHCECAALTGLVRVKHAQGETTTILPLLAEAEQLAQQYEYNDHLVSLRLTQVHLAWENQNKADILFFYRQAMVHALRFNRFLLDELLSGRPQETSLRPIIPYCLEHGEEGKEILVALRDWWKTGVNDIGTPRSDTISPIPEGISLLEAEKIVRGREPGDGTIQKSVVEQIEMVMK